MTRRTIWTLSVATSAEAEDYVGHLLTTQFGVPASTHVDVLKGTTTVSVFLDRLPVRWATQRAVVRTKLRELAAAGVDAGPARISVRRLPRENWAESWKRHFRPIAVGPSLLIKPSWSRKQPRRGQASVVLDPGLSFGTGQHATTRFCLRQLARHRRPGGKQGFLDVGTGSGILAIAAAKLGYVPVDAFDSDPDAVCVAKVNAKRNRVLGKLRIRRQDLTRARRSTGRQYDLVCANLTSSLLVAECQRLVGWLRPGGVLVLAGILDAEFGSVRTACEEIGLQLLSSRRECGWRSGAFARQRPIRDRSKA